VLLCVAGTSCSRISLILFSVMTCENAVFCILCGVAYFIYLFAFLVLLGTEHYFDLGTFALLGFSPSLA
jgi:hypothetical protein